MALVAYDNSDTSDYEDEDQSSTNGILIEKEKDINGTNETYDELQSVNGPQPSLFNLLPQPSIKKPKIIEADDEFLHKKESTPNIPKPKAKITVPSLNDFKDVESSTSYKPKTASMKKSGLLSMLPQPRNVVTTTITSKSMIPHVLTQKLQNNVKKKEPLPKQNKIEAAPKLPLNYSDDSDDDIQDDFFAINKPIEIPPDIVPIVDEPIENVLQPVAHKQANNLQSYFKADKVENHIEMQPDTNHLNYPEEPSYEAQSSSSVELDEEAIRKLCGSRGKRKREEIQIVDVNQQEVLADAREWLLKGLMDDTSKRVSSKKTGLEPTSQQRRKHQITYLAHQAKANEAELQNQWANNRVSKRQTQSKYGF